jgi:hypothetical protein
MIPAPKRVTPSRVTVNMTTAFIAGINSASGWTARAGLNIDPDK